SSPVPLSLFRPQRCPAAPVGAPAVAPQGRAEPAAGNGGCLALLPGELFVFARVPCVSAGVVAQAVLKEE
ncbi:hypothetical protein Nmel_004689, partial [Mimus melanotis]